MRYWDLLYLIIINVVVCILGGTASFEEEGQKKTTIEATTENLNNKEENSRASLSAIFTKTENQCVKEGTCNNDTNSSSNNLNNNTNSNNNTNNNNTNNNNNNNNTANNNNTSINNNNDKNDNNNDNANIRYDTEFESKRLLGEVIGPIFQKIHLALPRREVNEVGYEEETVNVNGRVMTVKQLSEMPPIFEISNFLSMNETDLIIDMVEGKGMSDLKSTPSPVTFNMEMNQRKFDEWDANFDGKISMEEFLQTPDLDSLMLSQNDVIKMVNATDVDKDTNGFLTFDELRDGGMLAIHKYLVQREEERSMLKGKGVKEAWLWHDEDELLSYENLLEDFHQRIKEITGIPVQLIEHSEPLQIQKREPGSFSPCQYDSPNIVHGKKCCVYGGKDCQMCRFASIHIFLNDVDDGGDLLFPLAHEDEDLTPEYVKEKILEKCEPTPNRTSSSLLIPAQRGKAVLWYNFHISHQTGWMGKMDTQSIVGMTTVGEKQQWSAKMWIDVVGDGVQELRPWRIGTNWLSENNKHTQLIETMRNDYFEEGGEYVHEHRKTYRRDRNNDHIMKRASPTHNVRRSRKDSRTNAQRTKSAKRREFQKVKQDKLKEFNPTEPLPPLGLKQTGGAENDIDLRNILKNTFTSTLHDAEDGSSSSGGTINSRYVQASLLLVQELTRVELETLARQLYDKLEVNCIPIIISPLGDQREL